MAASWRDAAMLLLLLMALGAAAPARLPGDDGASALDVRGLTRLIRAHPGGACLPTEAELAQYAPRAAAARGGAAARTPFYLDEAGALGMRELQACAETRRDSRMYDDVFPPNMATYISDLYTLRALRAHPDRVRSPDAARLHLTGLTPHLSWLHSRLCKQASGATHEERMRAAATALRTRALAANASGRARVWVLVHPSWNPDDLGDDVMALLRERALYGRFVVATGDRTYSGRAASWYRKHGTAIMPYAPSERLDRDARARREPTEPRAAAAARPTSVFFAGNMHRQRGEGKVRHVAIGALSPRLRHAVLIDRNFRHGALRDKWRNLSVEYAHEMARARFCLVPAGDVPTSRRLVDALAAGCVPLYIGSFGAMAPNLPYTSQLDWRDLAVFLGSVRCMAEHRDGLAQLGEALEELAPARLAAVRPQLRDAYERALSFWRGTATAALLRELYAQWPSLRGRAFEAGI